MYSCVSIGLWPHTNTQTHMGHGGLLSHSASRHHNPRDKEAQTTDSGRAGEMQCTHTHTHMRWVSTRLEHVPAACMLVCMCNHACCYLRAGQRWVVHGGEVQGLRGLLWGKRERGCRGPFWGWRWGYCSQRGGGLEGIWAGAYKPSVPPMDDAKTTPSTTQQMMIMIFFLRALL